MRTNLTIPVFERLLKQRMDEGKTKLEQELQWRNTCLLREKND